MVPWLPPDSPYSRLQVALLHWAGILLRVSFKVDGFPYGAARRPNPEGESYQPVS
jgi:hypothetical protein